MSNKNSIDYAELAGLRIALSNLKHTNTNPQIICWLQDRIEELESK